MLCTIPDCLSHSGSSPRDPATRLLCNMGQRGDVDASSHRSSPHPSISNLLDIRMELPPPYPLPHCSTACIVPGRLNVGQ